MNHGSKILIIWTVIGLSGGCASTKYITDHNSIYLQHQMHVHRSGVKTGDILLNTANFIMSVTLGTEFEITASERAFKHIVIGNESVDTMTVNMVTDIEWEDSVYCDIMGIVLPPKAQQKLLVPYPAAYHIFYCTPYRSEDSLLIQTNDKKKQYNLIPKN
jgi:hypothetical protein